ncbi:MAG TPA: DUF3422 domain-containing protein [Allosphingosinicella sp.]|jgi:uncharacterized membrane-anchored protein
MRFHDQREQLLAEVHARPSTPLDAPMLVTRLAALSSLGADDLDRAHMADLCRRFGHAGPAEKMRWCALDAGAWQLRWERHSEFSSWTFSRPAAAEASDALQDVPADWLAEMPGPVLVLTTVVLEHADATQPPPAYPESDEIGVDLLDGAATLTTDLRADDAGMTRYRLRLRTEDPVLTGRLALTVIEIETYRMMALLAFPVAVSAAGQLQELESEAEALAARLADDLSVEDDRALLTRLVALSGRMEQLSASTTFRFAAGQAYHGIVLGRIQSLRETPLPGMQGMGEFMDRRLGPAMRTCVSVAERERGVIARIARAGQMLNTRIELVTQAINADLLHSMDRRTLAQLHLQRTVEGLSVVAISYYALALLSFPLAALLKMRPEIDEYLAKAALAPIVVLIVWALLARVRRRIDKDETSTPHR